MNIYTTRFSALCPVNDQGIDYTLTIQTGEVLMVEKIREVLDGIREGLHEHIADQLCDKFGGAQRLKAMHHGVEIETIRPHLAHWSPARA
jgi:hypothetical protein